MAKAYDVPADILIARLADVLKNESIAKPDWAMYVKTGSHKQRPPHEKDWWYTRCASVFRKIYIHGPIGINDLRIYYGGPKAVGYALPHHRDSGGAIIRNAIHELERLGYVEKVEKKGRVVSHAGMKKLDRLASEILEQMAVQNPELKIYS
ncbi:MAG TPA: 30S ribosomal protein S19e [Candidatus Nitrosotenuis sp.]|nr:30S ribosomal protein S19e [Candidatus Nitrosotenuis sp.]